MAEKEGIGIDKKAAFIAFTTLFKRHIIHLLMAERGD
jgi:hypothetical protein